MPDPDVDTLYNDYSGKATSSSDVDVDALHKAYSTSTNETSNAPTKITIKPNIPQPFTPEDYALAEQQAKERASESGILNKLGQATKWLGSTYLGNVAGAFQSGSETMSSGLRDIAEKRPATGVGKVILGGLQAVPPVPLVTGAASTVGDITSQLTGSPEIGEKASMVVGSALPVVKGGQLINATRPTVKAINSLVEAIGPENLPEVIARLKANPRLSVMDVSAPVLQDAQKLAVTEGPGQDILAKAVQARAASAKGVVTGAYDTAMGVPVNVLQKLNDLKQAAKDVGSKAINPAIKGASPVDISPVIAHIDSQLKPGVMSVISTGQPLPFTDIKKNLAQVRQFLTNNKSVAIDADNLHQFQSKLRARADDLLNSSSGQDRQIGYALMNVRNKIVDAIDEASPKIADANGNMIGSYKPGLSKYRDEKQVEDAFVKGAQILRNRSGQWDDLPEFWKQWVDNATPEQLTAAKEGARHAIRQQMGEMKFAARKGTDVPQVEFSREKMNYLFGKSEVDKMAQKLEDERAIADTNSKLFQNSQTAMRLKSNARIDLPTKKEMGLGTVIGALGEIGVNMATGGGLPGAGIALGAGVAGARAAKFNVQRRLAIGKNTELSKLLTATGPDRDELIKTLESYLPQPKPSIVNRLGTAAARLPFTP